uniref:CNNM transmembrane domain-containing protein n=1 Tax=Macrostomum lignano TaxID=282301 RepID=A0A1I8ITV1_9PLAT
RLVKFEKVNRGTGRSASLTLQRRRRLHWRVAGEAVQITRRRSFQMTESWSNDTIGAKSTTELLFEFLTLLLDIEHQLTVFLVCGVISIGMMWPHEPPRLRDDTIRRKKPCLVVAAVIKLATFAGWHTVVNSASYVLADGASRQRRLCHGRTGRGGWLLLLRWLLPSPPLLLSRRTQIFLQRWLP